MTARSPERLFDPIADEVLWLCEDHVSAVLHPRTVYETVASALECRARGDYQQPSHVRPARGSSTNGATRGGTFAATAGYVGGSFDVAGIKWLADFPSNRERGSARMSGIIVLSSISTGRTFAVVE